MTQDPNLLALFSFNELQNPSTGTTSVDSSGNGNNGTYQGVGGAIVNTPGIIGTAADFDGVDDAVEITSSTLRNLTQNFTISAWINPDTVGKVQRILGADSFGFGLSSNQLIFTTFGKQDYIINANIQANQWTHVAVTFDNGYDATFYVNGVSIGTILGTAPANVTSRNFKIGAVNNIEFFDGQIDEVRVYNRVLSSPEIVTLATNNTITGIYAEYFSDRTLTNRVLVRTDANIDFNWAGSPAPGSIGNDNFSVRWTGRISPPTTGSYTFYATGDDGIRLWVNGQQLVNAWRDQASIEYSGTITLEAGQFYDLKMEYYEAAGGAVAKLAWSGPGISKQTIPANIFSYQPLTPNIIITQSGGNTAVAEGGVTDSYTVVLSSRPTSDVTIALNGGNQLSLSATTLTFTAANWGVPQIVTATAVNDAIVEGPHTGTITHTVTSTDSNYNNFVVNPITVNITDYGIYAEYFSDRTLTNRVLVRTDANIDFDWGTGSPAPGSIGSDNFSVRWTSKISPPTTGSYTFYATGDDGVRLWVNGQQLINGWKDQGSTEYSGTITLEAGKFYDLKMEYYEAVGGAVAKLAWSGPGISKQTIPANIFSYQPPSVNITQSGGNTVVTEGGATDSYTVVLNSQPTANVTIALNGGNQLSLT